VQVLTAGILLLAGTKTTITGAFIGSSITPTFQGIFGVIFVIESLMLFMATNLEYRIDQELPRRKNSFRYGMHTSRKYASKRGWDKKSIEDTIKNSRKVCLSREKNGRHRLAVVYYHPELENQYVVRTIDGNLLQVSDLNNPNWIPNDWRDKFVYLGQFNKDGTKKQHRRRIRGTRKRARNRR